MTWQKALTVGRRHAARASTRHRQGEQALRQAQKKLEQRNWQLAHILAIGNSLHLSLSLDSLLQEIVQDVHRSLGFGIVVLNLIEQDSGQMQVRAYAGLDEEARKPFDGAVYTGKQVAGLMQEQFRAGRCYFIPHGMFDWERDFGGPTYDVVSHEPDGDGVDQVKWHPEDALLVPLESRHGQIVGVLSLDQPLEGRRPDRETLQVLEIFANLAAVAVDDAQLYAQAQQELSERVQREEELRKLSLELENRVLERVAELNKANAELVREINERKRVETELLQRNRELLSLQAATIATTSSLDLQFVLETVTWEMASLLGVEGCAVLKWDQKADTLSLIAKYGTGGGSEEELGDEVYHLADFPLRKRMLVERYAQQMTAGQMETDRAELAYMQAANTKTMLLLPMIFQDRVLGLVELTDSQVERSFTDHQMALAQLLANQAASAVENAQLYRRAQQEIAERLRIEENINASLKEKELLLKEIHHRVKNNLQVISSLLNLQSKDIKDPSAIEMFRESQHRIRSMALIHEKLYRSRDLARIDFAEYVRDLATFLVRSYRSNSRPIALRVNAKDVRLGIDTAIPCGLIINELVSNSLKHAFPLIGDSPPGAESEIRVELRLSDARQLTLIVGDNGVGFPKGLDFRNTGSLGMQLVNTLVSQLDGTLELFSNSGTEFRITFPVS